MLSVLRSFTRTDFDYSPWHRLLEITAILSALGLMGWTGWLAVSGLVALGWHLAIWAVPTGLLVGYIGSDFSSGFVHWLGDTYGSEETPVLGENFVKPFRDHHVTPKGILDHDFVTVNGNNSVVLTLWLVPMLLIFNDPTSLLHLFALAAICSMSLGVFMTNQFHKWSHMEQPPGYATKLQDWGLILGRRHHDVHHTAPYDTYYCITCGWLNPLLQRIQFFETIERLVRRFFGVTTARDNSPATE